MNRKWYIEFEGVGQVLFERSQRAKRLNISIKPFRGVRIAVPHGIDARTAESLVRSRLGWIQRHMIKIRKLEDNYSSMQKPDVDRKEARRILAPRLNVLAQRHGFSYETLTIRNQKTRWGSCSARNNISLNAKLIRLPAALSDYVILHELVHTRIKHHGRSFWDELDKYVTDARSLRKELRQYHIAFV